MRKVVIGCCAAAALVCLLATAVPGEARGPYIGGGIWVGPGYWGPGPWWGPPYPYPYPAPPVIIQQAPVYVDPQPVAPPQAPVYWYYCQNPQGYYPYVKQCPGGWMQVVPPSTPPR